MASFAGRRGNTPTVPPAEAHSRAAVVATVTVTAPHVSLSEQRKQCQWAGTGGKVSGTTKYRGEGSIKREQERRPL